MSHRFVKYGWAVRVGGVLSVIVSLYSSTAFGQPLDRPVAAKPTRAEMVAVPTTGAVVVKFREGTGIRLRGGQLVGASPAELAGIESALRDVGLSASDLKRLHAAPEQRLDTERAQAQARTGRRLADLNLYYLVRPPAGASPADVAERLNRLDVVEFATPQPRPAPPPADLAPPTPDLSGSQGYKGPAPGGIGAIEGSAAGGDGSGVAFADVEYDWTLDHEDLELPASAVLDTGTNSRPFGPEHGTAVLGEIRGERNGYGVTGIAPAAKARVAAADTSEHGYSPERAIGLAAATLDAGDVVLVEQQFPACGAGFGPLEWYTPAYDAIAAAAAKGIIVVEAAGNGSVDLDGTGCGGRFDRNRYDTGAIIVGAGSPGTRERLFFSSYGSRVDVQGWGGSGTTPGHGDALDPGDARPAYTPTLRRTPR